MLEGAAQFFLHYLMPHPTEKSWLITGPSNSVENAYKLDGPVFNGDPPIFGVCMSPLIDSEILRELAKHLELATAATGATATGLVAKFRAAVNQVPAPPNP